MKFTFDQFVHYGIHHGGNVVRGFPWHFKFYDHPVTHLSDDSYNICVGGPHGTNFNRGDLIIIQQDGSLHFVSGGE